MTAIDGFPAQSGVVDPVELRKNLAGLIVRDGSGNARPGVFFRTANAIVTALASMNVAVAAFEAALVRGGGPILIANDGSVNVAIAAAPVSNSRIDVVWVRQKENGYGGFADGSNGPEVGVTTGTAAVSPTKPAIPTGALELATVLVPAGVSATNAGGVVITQTSQFTATTGGIVPVRNMTQRDSGTWAEGTLIRLLDTSTIQIRTGSGWDTLAEGGGWAPYTPSWAGASTPPVVGNGQLAGFFKRIGPKTVAIRIFIRFGSTSSGGTGTWSLGLPAGVVTPAGSEQVLTVKAFSASASQNFVGVAPTSAGATTFTPYLPASASTSALAPVQNANAAAAAGTGVPAIPGQYTYTDASNVVIEGVLEIA